MFISHPETQMSDMLILEGPHGQQAVNALLDYLLTERAKEWSLLLFDKLPMDSPTAYYLRQSLNQTDVRWESAISHESLKITLGTSWDQYLSQRSPRFRKTVRSIANRMAKAGRARAMIYEGKGTALEGIEKVFSVSEASWKVADGIAITSSVQRARFFKDLIDGATTSETVRAVILELDERPVASEIQIIDGKTIYALRSDYDNQYADLSPGSFLQAEILKDLFNKSYTEYNFGIGLNTYKSHWTASRHQLIGFNIYNRTLRGRLLGTVFGWEPKVKQLPGIQLLGRVLSVRYSALGK